MSETSDDMFYSDDSREEDSNFDPIIPDEQTRKPYQVEFKSYALADLAAFQQTEIAHVHGIIGTNLDTSSTLLRFFQWNKERLVECWMDNPAKVCEEAGVLLEGECHFDDIAGFCCDICCADDQGLQSFALSCGHSFCKSCYSHYLVVKISKEGESRRITCPADCNCIVSEQAVKLLVDDSVFEKF